MPIRILPERAHPNGRGRKSRAVMYRRFIFILLFAAALLLTACSGRYEPEEAQTLISEGREILKAWIDENLPGAEIASCSADEFSYPGGGNHYLTGYVSGLIDSEGEELGYTVSVKTGQVYLDADTDRFAEIARDYIFSRMELELEETEAYSVFLEIPYAYEGASKQYSLKDRTFTAPRLPAEIAMLLRAGEDDGVLAYIEHPEERDLLSVRLRGRVSDEADIRKYDLPFIRERVNRDGIYLTDYYFWHKDESVNGAAWVADYERRGWILRDGLKIRAILEMNADTLDGRSPDGDGIKRERNLYRAEDIRIEETETGYRISYENGAKGPCFYLYAEDGAELLEHEYTIKTEDTQQDLHWRYLEESDDWALVNADEDVWFFSGPAELIIRQDRRQDIRQEQDAEGDQGGTAENGGEIQT